VYPDYKSFRLVFKTLQDAVDQCAREQEKLINPQSDSFFLLVDGTAATTGICYNSANHAYPGQSEIEAVPCYPGNGAEYVLI
jgi:hypothetical protein